MIDFKALCASGMPSFGTLERALRFLASARGSTIYPPPPAPRVEPRPKKGAKDKVGNRK